MPGSNRIHVRITHASDKSAGTATAAFVWMPEAIGFVVNYAADLTAPCERTETAFTASITDTSTGTSIEVDEYGPHIGRRVAAALDNAVGIGESYRSIHPHHSDVVVYAYRSVLAPDAIRIDVEAAEGQRVLFTLNDCDLGESTVGVDPPFITEPSTA